MADEDVLYFTLARDGIFVKSFGQEFAKLHGMSLISQTAYTLQQVTGRLHIEGI